MSKTTREVEGDLLKMHAYGLVVTFGRADACCLAFSGITDRPGQLLRSKWQESILISDDGSWLIFTIMADVEIRPDRVLRSPRD